MNARARVVVPLLLLAGVCSPAYTFLDIYCLNVGQGDATLLVSPSGQTMLVDGGENGMGSLVILPFLESLGIVSLTYMVASHMEADHIGGLDEVAESFMPVIAYDHGGTLATPSCRDYLSAISPVRQTILPGQVIDLGAGVTVLCKCVNGAMDDGSSLTVENENDRSVGLLVKYNFFSFWVSGDLGGGERGQEDMESFVSSSIGDIDVLRVNHHGSDSSTNRVFLSDLQPEIAVISVGEANSYGHPAQEVLDRLGNQESIHAIVQTTAGTGNKHPKAFVANDHVRVRVHSFMYTVQSGDLDIRVPGPEPVSPSDLCDLLEVMKRDHLHGDLNEDGETDGKDLFLLSGIWRAFLPLKVPTPVPTPTATHSPTPTLTVTPTPSSSSTATLTPTNTPTHTYTPTETSLPTHTWTETPTASFSFTPTKSVTATNTPIPTSTSTATPTPTETNTDTPSRTSTRTDTPTPAPTNTSSSTPTPTETTIPGDARIELYSCLPNPAGADSGNEKVTLINRGNTAVDLTGWRVRDLANHSLWLSGTISPGERRTFTPSSAWLNNTGTETLYVVNPEGEVVHQGSYSGPVGEDEVIYFLEKSGSYLGSVTPKSRSAAEARSLKSAKDRRRPSSFRIRPGRI